MTSQILITQNYIRYEFFDTNYLKRSKNLAADCNLKLQISWSAFEKFASISLLVLVFLLLAIFEKSAVLRALSHLVPLKLKVFWG